MNPVFGATVLLGVGGVPTSLHVDVGGVPAPLLVGAGGVAGALARYGVDRVLSGKRGTAVVNVVGSTLLGVLSVTADGAAALALGAGFCGAFTTFSSLAVTVASRLERGERRSAATYAAGVLLLALAGVVVGRRLVRWTGIPG